ncbi:MAG TPA: hypothetical protein VGM50_13610 [Gemmatimonadaceae bacterium]|jgi:hypothetical protein
MSKNQDIQALQRLYKRETGTREVDTKAFAKWAIDHGYPLPPPIDPVDRLARDFAAALREETRTDVESGQPYRVNHMYVVTRGDEQLHLWMDIDEAPRSPMHASLTMRREQVVGDVTQLTFDAEHWNRVNPDQEPIEIEKDFGLDVELRRHQLEPQEV